MKLLTLILGEMRTNCYLLINEPSRECAVIDPADSVNRITERIDALGLSVKYIILTHAHFDHMLALEELRAVTKAPLALHALDAPALSHPEQTYMKQFGGRSDTAKPAEIILNEGDTLTLGEEAITVIHTPGHTKGSICLLCPPDIMISGDTLFRDDIGRYDLYGGDYRTLSQSLARISRLEGDRKVFPGHGPSTRLSYERQNNIEMN